jgi:hypothetical protein
MGVVSIFIFIWALLVTATTGNTVMLGRGSVKELSRFFIGESRLVAAVSIPTEESSVRIRVRPVYYLAPCFCYLVVRPDLPRPSGHPKARPIVHRTDTEEPDGREEEKTRESLRTSSNVTCKGPTAERKNEADRSNAGAEGPQPRRGERSEQSPQLGGPRGHLHAARHRRCRQANGRGLAAGPRGPGRFRPRTSSIPEVRSDEQNR